MDKIGKCDLKIVYSDGNFAYEIGLGMSVDVRHVISKSETYLVESIIRS